MDSFKEFQPKPPATKAVQFVGGEENGEELVRALRSEGVEATYMPHMDAWQSEDGSQGYAESPEQLKISGPGQPVRFANVGDWVIQQGAYTFITMKDEDFKRTYEEA